MAAGESEAPLSLPIVYGSKAVPLKASEAADAHTHKWTVYLRSPNNVNLGKFFKKVVFKLHESFTVPNRTLSLPPYEVTESGWGEFEIQIKLYLQDSSEQPITVYHFLKLYPDSVAQEIPETPTETVVSEIYDEIVLPRPSTMMRAIFRDNPIPRDAKRAGGDDIDYDKQEADVIARIRQAKEKIVAQTSDFANKRVAVVAELAEAKAEER